MVGVFSLFVVEFVELSGITSASLNIGGSACKLVCAFSGTQPLKRVDPCCLLFRIIAEANVTMTVDSETPHEQLVDVVHALTQKVNSIWPIPFPASIVFLSIHLIPGACCVLVCYYRQFDCHTELLGPCASVSLIGMQVRNGLAQMAPVMYTFSDRRVYQFAQVFFSPPRLSARHVRSTFAVSTGFGKGS